MIPCYSNRWLTTCVHDHNHATADGLFFGCPAMTVCTIRAVAFSVLIHGCTEFSILNTIHAMCSNNGVVVATGILLLLAAVVSPDPFSSVSSFAFAMYLGAIVFGVPFYIQRFRSWLPVIGNFQVRMLTPLVVASLIATHIYDTENFNGFRAVNFMYWAKFDPVCRYRWRVPVLDLHFRVFHTFLDYLLGLDSG